MPEVLLAIIVIAAFAYAFARFLAEPLKRWEDFDHERDGDI